MAIGLIVTGNFVYIMGVPHGAGWHLDTQRLGRVDYVVIKYFLVVQ